MDCTNARLLLNYRTAGSWELAAPEREDLDAHLAGCPLCAAQASDDARLDAHLGRAVRDVPVPAGLRERLLAAVVPLPVKPKRRWPRRVGFGLGMAAAASIALMLGVLYFGRGPLRPPISPADVQMGYIAAPARDVDAVNEELHLLGARRCAPPWANYTYLTGAPSLAVLPGHRDMKVKVPQLVFTRGNQRVLLYVLSNRLYKLEDFESQGAYDYNLAVIRPEKDKVRGYSYLILYTGTYWDWIGRPDAAK